MAKKGYLEDLWPYIESDPELGRDSVVEAPLKAAERRTMRLSAVYPAHTIFQRCSAFGDPSSAARSVLCLPLHRRSSRDSVVEAPLKAAEVDGGLYMLFSNFAIRTLAGAPEVVGDQFSWNLDELWKAFSTLI